MDHLGIPMFKYIVNSVGISYPLHNIFIHLFKRLLGLFFFLMVISDIIPLSSPPHR